MQPWWRDAVVYQVYPRSFADSGATRPQSGVGDLVGLIERLDHLAWLGVDAVWLSPVFRSPMADFGYDVSDYCDIDPTFGTIGDMDRLVEAAHARGIRVLLDWVPNHTSDQHPWFEESRRDRTNARADWYVWRDEPANNWNASFLDGVKAWTFDPERGQHYLHCFLPQQPDLDWSNPQVERAMLDTLRFWLDRGIDGFRMDVIHLLGKEVDTDDPVDAVERGWSHVTFNDVAATHDHLRAIRGVLDEYEGDRVSVGEVYLLDEERMASYLGTASEPELHLSFNFRFLWAPWDARALGSGIMRTMDVLRARDGWPTWVLSNHDVPRHRQRHGGSDAGARMAALMLLTLPGTPFLYQGEELGLVDADVPADRVVDPGGRDGCRAPIPWDDGPLHGWHDDPWLPFPPEAASRNVATQRADPRSMLHWYRTLLAFRRGHPALHTLDIEVLELGADVLAYRRRDLLVVLNLSEATSVALPGGQRVLLSSRDSDADTGMIHTELPPLAAWVTERA